MKEKKAKIHNDEWFEANERLIAEPIDNTLKYYRKPFYIALTVYVLAFVLTYDYYGTAKGFSRLNEWLPTALSVGIFVALHGLQSLWLFLTIRRIKNIRPCTLYGVLYNVFSLPLIGAIAITATKASLIWAIVNAVLYAIRLSLFFVLKEHVRNGFECRYYAGKFQEQKENYLGKGRSVTLIGAPGSGKTVLGGTVSVTLAEQRWEKLKFDFFTENARKDYYIKTLNVEKLKRLQALKESYLFYKEREETKIPCLVTSIGIQDLSGRYSYVLTSEVYAQLKRVPEYSVLFNDESGREQGCQTSKSASENVLDFWRLNRHFGDFILINTEQGADGNGKYIRKCTDYNIRCYWQEWVLPPRRLQAKFEKRKEKFEIWREEGKLTEEEEKYILQELYYRAKYIATIGFRKIRARKEGTPEQGSAMISEDEEFKIIPSRTIYNYDERAYAELYRCADEPISLTAWTSLTLNGDIVSDDIGSDVITASD